jgi:hypothetical protein
MSEPATPDPAAINARDRIQVEYIEMPGLKLTAAQVRRLCDLPSDACETALNALVHAGVLRRLDDGSFLRPGLVSACRPVPVE